MGCKFSKPSKAPQGSRLSTSSIIKGPEHTRTVLGDYGHMQLGPAYDETTLVNPARLSNGSLKRWPMSNRQSRFEGPYSPKDLNDVTEHMLHNRGSQSDLRKAIDLILNLVHEEDVFLPKEVTEELMRLRYFSGASIEWPRGGDLKAEDMDIKGKDVRGLWMGY